MVGTVHSLTVPTIVSTDAAPRLTATVGEWDQRWGVTWIRTTHSFVGESTTQVMAQLIDTGGPTGDAPDRRERRRG